MKKSFNTYSKQLTTAELNQLTRLTEETLAMEMTVNNRPQNNFSAATLWNIQRNRRSFVQRRYIL